MAAGDLTTRTTITRRDELGELGKTFNQMADKVEQTVASLQQFVADAAHELHTPLTALRTRLELVERPDIHTVAAQQQVRHLQRISEDLLTLSRLDNALQPPQMERMNWSELISMRLELVAARAEQAQIDFDVNLPDSPVWVVGNKAQLQQVFDNLLDNALKFTPAAGSVTVELATDGTLVIRDTGIGIENAEGIFGRFHRAPNAAPYPGSGLGLAIVAAIVAAHAGQISVTSQLRPTEFRLILPTVSI
jgi:signal transduction histidine kinase